MGGRDAGANVIDCAVVTTGFAAAGGMLSRARLLAMLDALSVRGVAAAEVMLHPGRTDAETRRRYGHWRYHWDRDLELLCDPVLADELDRRGMEVTSFRDLGATARAAGSGRVAGSTPRV
jgi:predicted glycoside hydrolase/deacetylase ChbG (UPF0249 family)